MAESMRELTEKRAERAKNLFARWKTMNPGKRKTQKDILFFVFFFSFAVEFWGKYIKYVLATSALSDRWFANTFSCV